MTRVCHISPVHDLVDNRVFYKECHSLRDAGYEVIWIVQHDRNEVKDGVNIIALRPVHSRWRRWCLSGWEAFRAALRTKAALIHFHDPEFIPYALLLRLSGKQVIYDIHEDYVSSLSQKLYIPARLRSVLGRIAGAFEKLLSIPFERVIAERYYEDRFPKAVKVLNYPKLDGNDAGCRRSEHRLLYTGKVHLHRGAKIHARIPGLVAGTSVSFVGRCDPQLFAELERENAAHWDKLTFTGVGENVPFQRILDEYRNGEWLAGLAIFPKSQHLERKELTKFFEYMQHGLPIIASHFPTWRRLVEDNECGICVDPDDDEAIVEAVSRLQRDPELWKSMSQNGMKAVQDQYSWASQERALLGLYRQLLTDSASG